MYRAGSDAADLCSGLDVVRYQLGQPSQRGLLGGERR